MNHLAKYHSRKFIPSQGVTVHCVSIFIPPFFCVQKPVIPGTTSIVPLLQPIQAPTHAIPSLVTRHTPLPPELQPTIIRTADRLLSPLSGVVVRHG